MLGGHVRPPHPVALLQPEPAESAAAARDDAQRLPSLPQEIPQPQAEISRGVELPPELPDVREPERDDRNLTHEDPVRSEEPERLVREVVLGQALDQLARARPPYPDAARSEERRVGKECRS